MILIVLAMALFCLGAIFSYKDKAAYMFSSIASLLSLIAGLTNLYNKIYITNIRLTDSIVISLSLDHLSALFLIIASVSWMAISIFSINYGYMHKKESGVWFNLIFLGMLIVLLANDSISLLMGWEAITILGFLMIIAEENVKFRHAFSFMAFGEFSTITLLIGFGALYLSSGSTNFIQVKSVNGIFLIFASIGFFVKMDIFPFHTWMKNVYKDAPTNVCAVLSAPVTLMGVYGLIRVLQLNGVYLQWWLIVLLILGGISAFWGALHAAATIGIRTLPAYSTVENNGIILIAVSVSFLAMANQKLFYLSNFAMASAIIVAIAHTLGKTLLFISTGHAKEAYSAHTIDDVRGVWKGVGKIPALGILISGLSLSAFPPLIGYVGEWMILEGIFQSYRFNNDLLRFILTFVGILLALGIGLTAFSMVKFIGYSALGYHHEKKAKKFPAQMMIFSEILLIVLLIGAGIFAPFIFKSLDYSYMLAGLLAVPKPLVILSGKPIFGVLAPTFFPVVTGVLFLFPLFIYLKTKNNVKTVNSWNGGLLLQEEEYFSAGGFSYILEHVLKKVYNTREILTKGKYKISIEDRASIFYIYTSKIFKFIGTFVSNILMSGKVYIYISYILFMLLLSIVIAKAPN